MASRWQRAWRALTSSPAEAAAPAPAPNRSARESFAHFRAAQMHRLLADWIVRVMSPHEEIRGDFLTLRARARELDRNEALVNQYVGMLTANVIGPTGPRLQARVRDERGELDGEVNDRIEEAWDRWHRAPVSADRKLNLVQFEHLQLHTTARDGESFTRFRIGESRRHGLALQGIDPDLVDETFNAAIDPGRREVMLGIEVDGDGGPMAYHVRQGPTREAYRTGDRVRIPAEEVLHHFQSRRAHQMRGVSWLAPVMLLLHHDEHYTEAELVASRVGAANSFFITSPEDAAVVPRSTSPEQLEANPGMGLRLGPGEGVETFTPNHPTTAFSAFDKSIKRRVASGLRASYTGISNDLEGANYSSMKNGLQLERENWRMLQEWWISTFRVPVYEQWLQTAIASGELRLPSADWRRYTAARWIPRGWQFVEPLKEAQASILLIGAGLTSITRVLGEQGLDLEDIIEERKREKELFADAGIELSTDQPAAAPVASNADDNADEDEDTPPARGSSSALRAVGR